MSLGILVTGAGGFVGGRLVEWLCERSQSVTGWTRATVDLENRDAVDAAMDRLRPDVVFHLATIPARANDTDWRSIAREVAMLDGLARSMPRTARLIYCGSMAEIGHSGIHDEQVWCQPNTLYGAAKFAGTNRSLALAQRGYAITVARLFGVYGPGEGKSRLIPALALKLARGQPVALSDGQQVRDFVHVDDVCATLWALATNTDPDAPALVNIGTGQGLSVKKVCQVVAKIIGVDPSLLQFGALPRRYVDEHELVASVALLRRSTGLTLDQRFIGPDKAIFDYVMGLTTTHLSGTSE